MSEQNAEHELIAQLNSDKRSVRIQAIVKLARIGRTEFALRALVPYLTSDDRELSFFASQAASKIAQKAGVDLKTLINQANDTPLDSDEYRQEIFLSPDKNKIQELLNLIRKTPEQIPEASLPAVGVFLSKYGDVSDGIFIERFLLKENSNLALPFISAAETIAPAVLPRVLPNLLASSEPLVRSRSISALRRIDPEEAERHFSDLLSSRDPENRLAGTAIALLFPFARVKGYILSMLPDEQDTEVLGACEMVLASNPEIDTALSILDIIDAVAADSRNRLSQVFKTLCSAIALAGILPKEQATPDYLVKLWKQQRLQNFLVDLEIQLPFADKNKRQSIILWIEKNRQHPKVVELIERLGKNPQTEEIYRQLTAPAPAAATAPGTTVSEPKKQVSTQPTNETEKLATLKTLELESFAEHKTWILKEAAEGSPAVRAEALNTLHRVRPDGKLKDLAKKALKEDNNEVKIAAFKILERIDPEYLKTIVSDLMLDNDANLRVRAIRFGLKFKEKDSIEALKQLVNSTEQNIRSNAVNCLAFCPFNLVFKILMDQLDKEEHPVIARQIVSILQSNPSKSVLKALDSITKTSNPAVTMVISQARNDLFETITQIPEVSESEPLEVAAENKPYSVQNVREIARKNQNWKPSYKPVAEKAQQVPKFSEINWQMLISGSVLLIFLGLLPIMLLSDKGAATTKQEKIPQEYRNTERVKPYAEEIPAKFRMHRACSLYGKVEKIISDTSLVMVHDGRQIMVKFLTAEAKAFANNDAINVTIVPYRVNPNGIILSRGQKIVAHKGE
ncbi:MAG: hypothetical protein EOM80_13595 [Erysipelotrichia bacterium]|nr:hypothetical protein [Erysipelotrichia bacterium]